jgi:hypothetical protein
MGALTRLREELEQLTGELDDASSVPDAQRQPEMARARAVLDDARDAVSSAFLSRRAMTLARESIERAQFSVREALTVSRALRERAAALKSDADEIRATAAEVREASAALARRLGDGRDPGMTDAPGGTVTIDSGIPAEHPAKAPIELALTQALTGAGGEWHVWITVSASGLWWGLRVHGPSVEWVGTLEGADEQTPEAVAGRVKPLVLVARAEALYHAGLRRGRRDRREI